MIRKRLVFLMIVILFIATMGNAYASMFFDDTLGHWAEEEIVWATNDVSLFQGYEDGTFRPDDFITRGEYISILYRMALDSGLIDNKLDEVADSTIVDKDEYYTDLNQSYWGFDNIEGLKGFINSIDSKMKFKDIFASEEFKPNKYITRKEAALLLSYFDLPAIESEVVNFKDLETSTKYYDEIVELVNNKIIQGYEDNTFKPQNNITRAESAVLLKRLFKEIQYKRDYLNEVLVLKDIYDNKFRYFGKYFGNDSLSENDKKYVKALRTLEYLDFIETIPYDERDNYDSNPMKTLKDLKDQGYWNKIGISYYLIKNNEINIDSEPELVDEILNEYLSRSDLKEDETKFLFNNILIKSQNRDLMNKAFDKWMLETNAIDEYDVTFAKAKYFSMSEDYELAWNAINDVYKFNRAKKEDIEALKILFYDKSYVEFKLGRNEDSVRSLKQLLNIIRFYAADDYSLIKDESEVISYLKALLVKIETK